MLWLLGGALAAPPPVVAYPDDGFEALDPVDFLDADRVVLDLRPLGVSVVETRVKGGPTSCRPQRGQQPVFTREDCPHLFARSPGGTVSVEVVTTKRDLSLSLGWVAANAQDGKVDATTLTLPFVPEGIDVGECLLWIHGAWTRCEYVEDAHLADARVDEVVAAIEQKVDVQLWLRGATRQVRYKLALEKDNANDISTGAMTIDDACAPSLYNDAQVVCVDASAPERISDHAETVVEANKPVAIVVFSPSDVSVQIGSVGDALGFTASSVINSEVLTERASADRGRDYATTVRRVASLKPGRVPIAIAVKKGQSSFDYVVDLLVDQRIYAAFRVGVAGTWGLPRPGTPLRRYDVVTPDGSSTQTLRDKGPDHWVSGEATAGISFFLDKVSRQNLSERHFAWYLGTGLLRFGDGLDPVQAIPSLHTGPELSLGSTFSIAATGSVRAATALAADLSPGDALDSDTLPSRIVPVFGFGVVLNLSSEGFTLFTKGGGS